MQIDLSDDEAIQLVKVVNEYYSDLRAEIHRTETLELKNELKHEESIIRRIIEKLTSAQSKVA